jgi:hypothetical protein
MRFPTCAWTWTWALQRASSRYCPHKRESALASTWPSLSSWLILCITIATTPTGHNPTFPVSLHGDTVHGAPPPFFHDSTSISAFLKSAETALLVICSLQVAGAALLQSSEAALARAAAAAAASRDSSPGAGAAGGQCTAAAMHTVSASSPIAICMAGKHCGPKALRTLRAGACCCGGQACGPWTAQGPHGGQACGPCT